MDFEIEEDEDVVLEDSELHKLLQRIGYTDIEYAPIHKVKSLEPKENTFIKLRTWGQSFCHQLQFYYRQTTQENQVRQEQLKTILKSEVLLDDHTSEIQDFLNKNYDNRWKQTLEWLPLAGPLLAASLHTLILKQKNVIPTAIAISTIVLTSYFKFQRSCTTRNLKQIISLQNDLHSISKRVLKILRRGQNLRAQTSDKFEILGKEKQQFIIPMKELLLQIFKNLSQIYYDNSKTILKLLPPTRCLNDLVTELKDEFSEIAEHNENQTMKNWYYTYVLTQSEMLHVLAMAYNGIIEWKDYRIPEKKLNDMFKLLIPVLKDYHFKAFEIMKEYDKREIQPIRREFRNTSNSKFQDLYIHLDLTSNRIQQSYQEIISMLNKIDSLTDETNDDFIESLVQSMDDAYKQIETARSFAEFSTLLLAKLQNQISKKELPDAELPLFPTEECKTVIINEDPEILDEVFEEYINEEYLKPLSKDCDEELPDFKISKLLAKNLIGELKEVLIEKQKSMSERELIALRRMYKNIKKISISDQCSNDTAVPPPLSSLPPPPPPLSSVPPPPPPLPSVQSQTSEKCFKKVRTPVPLPRVKTFKTEPDAAEIPRLSIKQCSSSFVFPENFKFVEETFDGSGENSEEEFAGADCEDNDPET